MTTNIKKLFIGEFLSQTVAIYTLYAIMFTERGSLSGSQVGILLGTLAFTTLVTEIPTGMLADRIARKYSLVLSKVLLAVGMACWLIFPNFWGYFVGMVLMGLAESLSSGAMQAYLYEDLSENSSKFTKYNTRLWATMMSAFLVGSGLAALVGPRYETLLVLSVCAPLLGAAVFMTLRKDDVSYDGTHLQLLKESAGYLLRTPQLLTASLLLIILKAMVDLLIEYIPLYYKDSGVAVRYVPLVFFVGNAITIVLFWYGSYISSLLKKAEIRVLLVLIAMFIMSRFYGTAANVLGIFWFVRFTRVLYVFEEGEIQHRYASRFRATITSINSMGARLALAISLPLVGYVSQNQFYGDSRTPIIIFTSASVAILIAVKLFHRKLTGENNHA